MIQPAAVDVLEPVLSTEDVRGDLHEPDGQTPERFSVGTLTATAATGLLWTVGER